MHVNTKEEKIQRMIDAAVELEEKAKTIRQEAERLQNEPDKPRTITI